MMRRTLCAGDALPHLRRPRRSRPGGAATDSPARARGPGQVASLRCPAVRPIESRAALRTSAGRPERTGPGTRPDSTAHKTARTSGWRTRSRATNVDSTPPRSAAARSAPACSAALTYSGSMRRPMRGVRVLKAMRIDRSIDCGSRANGCRAITDSTRAASRTVVASTPFSGSPNQSLVPKSAATTPLPGLIPISEVVLDGDRHARKRQARDVAAAIELIRCGHRSFAQHADERADGRIDLLDAVEGGADDVGCASGAGRHGSRNFDGGQRHAKAGSLLWHSGCPSSTRRLARLT